MAPPQLFLNLTIVDATSWDVILRDLTASVLQHVGYGTAAIDDILDTLPGAVEQGGVHPPPECRAQFRTEPGRLIVAVSFGDGRDWRATRPLPPAD